MAWSKDNGSQSAVNAAQYVDGKKPLIEKAIVDASEAKPLAESAKEESEQASVTAEQADAKATDALAKATTAKTVSETVQSEFDQVVAEAGSNNPEVVQARGGEANLKARLDKTTAQLAETEQKKADKVDTLVSRYSNMYGGQLSDLSSELGNPFNQYLGITFVGDSITWGFGATGTNPQYNSNRDGTLSDVRDNISSKSFVNNFKRYIGAQYVDAAEPNNSNWFASPSGEAIALYEKEIMLYPSSYGFEITNTNYMTKDNIVDGNALLGRFFKFRKTHGYVGDGVLNFNFTGEEFEIAFNSTSTTMDYELIVDGVSQGIFNTRSGVGGIEAGYNNRRKHSFDYVRSKSVQIKAITVEGIAVAQELRLSAIIIPKKIRITNQGIIGINAYRYKSRNMPGNTTGDGVAVDKKDMFIFCMLGTNDRLSSTDYAKGQNQFRTNLETLLTDLISFGNVIFMVANPVENEVGNYTFTMQEARNVIRQIAKEKNIDFIDNYTIFSDIPLSLYTDDGIHPNDFGYYQIYQNIVYALNNS